MKKLNTMGLVFFVLLSMVSGGYSACEGDITCNGTVDGSDLAMFAADFGTTGCGTCDDVVARIEDLEDKIAQLETLLQHFTRSGNDIYIDGANLHIRSGSGETNGAVNGLGNLLVGYNEQRSSGNIRTGSHNVIIGEQHNYSSYGGLVTGVTNTLSGVYSSVTGGVGNIASGAYSSVSGGGGNTASGTVSSVSGGTTPPAACAAASVAVTKMLPTLKTHGLVAVSATRLAVPMPVSAAAGTTFPTDTPPVSAAVDTTRP